MNTKIKLAAVLILTFFAAIGLATITPAPAQVTIPGQRMVPLGYCQIATLTSSIGITAANCVRASFTATASGTNLTTTSVTGTIKVGDLVAGTGVTTGTRINSQTSGTAGGAGVYVISLIATSSAASLTSGGPPLAATAAWIQAEAQIIRYRDDAVAPTAGIGNTIAAAGGILYVGDFSLLRFIEATATAKANIAFYR